MDYKTKIKKLRIIALALILIGFVGAIITICIAASIYGDHPSIGSIFIISIFGFLMISPLLFILIPFRKAIKNFNNIILNEFGTFESRTKTYELYFSGFEILEQNEVNINSKAYYAFSKYVPRISKMFFSPSGFHTRNEFPSRKGIVSFKWNEINKILIDVEKMQIVIFLNNKIAKVSLPLQKNIYYLIKTFHFCEIENETDINSKMKK